MITRQRTDLHMNVPALKKLDGMLLVRSSLSCSTLHDSFLLRTNTISCSRRETGLPRQLQGSERVLLREGAEQQREMVDPDTESSSERPVRGYEEMAAVSEGFCASSAQSSHGYKCTGLDGDGDPRKLHRSSS